MFFYIFLLNYKCFDGVIYSSNREKSYYKRKNRLLNNHFEILKIIKYTHVNKNVKVSKTNWGIIN